VRPHPESITSAWNRKRECLCSAERGTSLIRNRPTSAPYSRFMSRAVVVLGGVAVSFERGTPVPLRGRGRGNDGAPLMAPRTDRTTRIPSGVASPVTTNHAAKGSVFVSLRNTGNLKHWRTSPLRGRGRESDGAPPNAAPTHPPARRERESSLLTTYWSESTLSS